MTPRGRRLRRRDLVSESVSAVAAKPGRAALTAFGTVLGVGALVATLGLTSTARSQISEQFDAYEATEVRIEGSAGSELLEDAAPGAGIPSIFPADADARLARVPGVQSSGVFWSADTAGVQRRWSDTADHAGAALPVFAVSPGALDVVALDVGRGRVFDEFHQRRGEPVILLSRAAARALEVTDVVAQPVVFIGSSPFTVIGIYGDARRHPEVLAGVIVPSSAAARVWGLGATGRHQILVATQPGAAQVVSRQAAVALRPNAPESLTALAPPDPKALRAQVDSEVANLFLVLSVVSVAAGAFGIANTTLVSVLERVPEIGLRRALGARRMDVARQFLLESALLGTAGGVAGAVLGTLIVAVVSIARTWTATVEPLALLPAPLLGTITGLLAGVYPAIHAAGIAPAEALKR